MCGMGMVTVMCTTTSGTLTLAALLQDPLIQMVMRSDNVTDKEHSELLHRVQNSLIAREATSQSLYQTAVWGTRA